VFCEGVVFLRGCCGGLLGCCGVLQGVCGVLFLEVFCD